MVYYKQKMFEFNKYRFTIGVEVGLIFGVSYFGNPGYRFIELHFGPLYLYIDLPRKEFHNE